MPTTARAPVFLGEGAIEFHEIDYPDPGPGELLIRVEANAICGTDRAQYQDGSEFVPGHEAAGVVVAAGPGTVSPPGTRGVIYLMDYCGVCRSCLLGFTNQCLAKRRDMGFTAHGGYGPFEVVSQTVFFPVPADITAVDATLLLDVMGTSGHALGRIAAVRQDVESLYVAGAGPVGLGVIAMAKARFGSDFPVYVADLDLWRLEFAESLGATVDDAAHPSNLTADIAVDTTGAPGARRRALDCLAQRGALALVGHGRRLELEVSPDLIAPERAILGSEYFRFDELQPNLNILLSTPKRFKQIITDVLPRSEIKEAFSLFLTGRTGKVVVVEDPS